MPCRSILYIGSKEVGIRVLLGIVRFVVIFAPIVLIAILGAFYVASCLDAVSAPGVPIEFRYKSQAGSQVRVWATSYAFDWRQGYLQLTRPRMVAADGSTVAQLDNLSLSGLNIWWGADQVVDARASDLQARLVRLPTGRFELEDLLPERTEEPSRIPFRFRLDQARVMLIDRMAVREWRKPALVTSLIVEGVGDDWIATAGAYVTGVGRVSGRIQSVYNRGISVAAETPGMELAPILAHLQTTPERKSLGELAKVHASSLRVTGPFAVFLPATGKLQAETNLRATARDISYGEYHARTAEFSGIVTPNGARGKAKILEGPMAANFDGSVDWTKVYRLGGVLKATAPSVAQLPRWVRRMVPAQVSFRDGSYDGWLSVTGGRAVADGTLVASHLRVANESIDNPIVRLHLDERSTLIRLVGGNYMGRAASGVLTYDFRTGVLSAAVNSTRTTLEPLVARYPQLKGLQGVADLSVRVAGTTKNPTVNFEARGSATYDRPGWRRIAVDRFDLIGTYRGGVVVVTRGTVEGPGGLAVVNGNVTENGKLSLNVQGRGLNLGAIDRRLAGNANLRGTVVGTIHDPRASGRIELYNTAFDKMGVTAAAANFVADRRRARLESLNAYRGAANITGVLEYRFANQGIAGSLVARNVQLEDLFGSGYVGSLSTPALVIGGTVSRPVVRGLVLAKDVVVRGVKVESATALTSLVGSSAEIAEGTASIAGGKANVSGTYNIKSQAGTFTTHLSNIDLNQLAPAVARYATVAGSLNGDATIQTLGTNVTNATGNGRLTEVVVNKTPFGDGPWEVGYNGQTVTGSVDVGFLDRYVSLSDLRFDPMTQAVAGKVDLFNAKLEDLVEASIPSMPGLAFENEQRLRAITGVVNLASSFGGTVNNPSVDIENLQATDLTYRKTDFGNLTASVGMADRNWTIRNFALNGPAGNFAVNGTIAERGALELNGDLNGLNLNRLSVIDARFAEVGGFADVSFDATGPTSSPEIRASITGRGLFAASDNAPEDQTLRVLLDTVSITETKDGAGGLNVAGNYFYRGFQGRITASAPVDYPFAIGGDGRVNAEITLVRRDLKEIAGLVNSIDADRTSGYVEGSFRGTGTIDNFAVSGGVALHADTLGFEYKLNPYDLKEEPKPIDTSFKNVDASFGIAENQVSGKLSAESGLGGSVSSELTTNINDFRQLAENFSTGGIRQLLDNAVAGQVTFADFRVRQSLADKGYVDSTVGGEVSLGGTIQRPRITGQVSASNLDAVLPIFEASSAVGAVPAVDPSFDLRFALATSARIRTATADLRVNGEGSLQGSLTQPNLRAAMTVQKGTIRLPASTVRLDPDGDIDLRYRVTAGEPFAALDVDLTGHTAVTALSLIDVPQRYDILLELRGDLLKEGGLNLVATSDPPDLSQERILTLLGSVDLFSSFLSSGAASGTEDRLRGALIGYALPVVFDPFTSKIASALGLEYLSLEYNQYQQATIAFARALTPELIIEGSRQVTQPAPGFLQQYELRLVYRPRRVKGVLRRVSLSVGTDQERPWKVALDYGVRF